MGFGDLKTEASLKTLNEFLADKSYIEGYTPTAGDAVVFAALSKAPGATLCHALRWYNHIKSYGNDSAKFPGAKKPVASYGPAGGAPAAAAKADDDDDDDFDLFGDDEEDEDAAEKLKQKRIAEYTAKKSKTEEAPKVPDAEKKVEEDDDDFDLFGSETEEDKEAQEKLKQERVDAYAAKKSKKPTLIAKSSIILDVKPWDDETDMAEMEKLVRTISADGLVWGASKLVPVGYGIKKLQIICVVEDDKVGTDFLEEKITAFEDLVQSMDIAAFNKI